MPTKTNDSPLQTNGLIAGLASKANGFTGVKIGGVVGKGLIKGAAKANPLGAAITGAQALFGGIKEVAQDRREAKDAGVKYGLFEGIKDFSDWPTIPQLYVKKEFVGGCDIVKEMFEKGELKTLLISQKII